MDSYTFNLARDYSLNVPDDFTIIFLCGVIFNKGSDEDKRTVLKNYLAQTPGQHPIILEENFAVPSYSGIDLQNLYDVETLVACFANATIIIHESLSTGAELGMLASNTSTASKLLVLYPDTDSVEERKISGFIRFAYFKGAPPVLSEESSVVFNPILRKNYESNDRYVYHTTFPDSLQTASRARDSIDAFLKRPASRPLASIRFEKPRYNTPTTNQLNVIDYYCDEEEDKDKLLMHVSPMALRELLFSLLSLEPVRERVIACTSIIDIMGVLQADLNALLLSTHNNQMGTSFESIKVSLKGLALSTFQDNTTDEYRKAIGLFIYLLKAMGYLSSKDNQEFKFTGAFVSIRDQFKDTVAIKKKSTFTKQLKGTDAA